MTDPTAEQARLQRFWTERYRTFSLSESGWLGAGESRNHRLYACKAAALTRALERLAYRPKETRRVLDAGCGQGFFAEYYRRRFPGWTYVGVDLAPTVVAHLELRQPGCVFAVGDISTWRAADGAPFDIIQSFEVLHLFLNDELVATTIANLAGQLTGDGALLVTAVLPTREAQPNPYIRHMTRRRFDEAARAAGLVTTSEEAMYYWLPDGGPSNRYLRYVFDRLGDGALFAADRAALALRLPRLFQSGFDSQMKLITLRRMAPS